MTGLQFEYYCAAILEDEGFTDVEVTQASGDQGIDVLAKRNGAKYAIQCKYYSSPVGNSAVQQAYAGMTYYNCDIAMVMTNSTFTNSARDLADRTGVLLRENVFYTPQPFWKRAVCRAINISLAIISAFMALLTIVSLSSIDKPGSDVKGTVIVLILCFIIYIAIAVMLVLLKQSITKPKGSNIKAKREISISDYSEQKAFRTTSLQLKQIVLTMKKRTRMIVKLYGQ